MSKHGVGGGWVLWTTKPEMFVDGPERWQIFVRCSLSCPAEWSVAESEAAAALSLMGAVDAIICRSTDRIREIAYRLSVGASVAQFCLKPSGLS